MQRWSDRETERWRDGGKEMNKSPEEGGDKSQRRIDLYLCLRVSALLLLLLLLLPVPGPESSSRPPPAPPLPAGLGVPLQVHRGRCAGPLRRPDDAQVAGVDDDLTEVQHLGQRAERLVLDQPLGPRPSHNIQDETCSWAWEPSNQGPS